LVKPDGQRRTLNTTLSRNAMRCHGRMAIDTICNGLALDARKGQCIAAVGDGEADARLLRKHSGWCATRTCAQTRGERL
jgi:hypothetical protein